MLAFRSRVAKRRGHGRAALSSLQVECSTTHRPAVWDPRPRGQLRQAEEPRWHRDAPEPARRMDARVPRDPPQSLPTRPTGRAAVRGGTTTRQISRRPQRTAARGRRITRSTDRNYPLVPRGTAAPSHGPLPVARPTGWVPGRASQFRWHRLIAVRRADDGEGRRRISSLASLVPRGTSPQRAWPWSTAVRQTRARQSYDGGLPMSAATTPLKIPSATATMPVARRSFPTAVARCYLSTSRPPHAGERRSLAGAVWLGWPETGGARVAGRGPGMARRRPRGRSAEDRSPVERIPTPGRIGANAMSLGTLAISDLRCIEQAEFELTPGLTLLWGENGSGKTSVLEAIFLLGRGRSFRTRNNERLIRRGADRLRIVGQVSAAGDAMQAVGFEASRTGTTARIGGRPA